MMISSSDVMLDDAALASTSNFTPCFLRAAVAAFLRKRSSKLPFLFTDAQQASHPHACYAAHAAPQRLTGTSVPFKYSPLGTEPAFPARHRPRKNPLNGLMRTAWNDAGIEGSLLHEISSIGDS